MAIAPINNTITKNYNIGFTGLKLNNNHKNDNNHRNSSSMMKAIPLATLLAMSPLTVQNLNAAERIDNPNHIEMVDIDAIDDIQQERTVVQSKEFPLNMAKRKSVRVDLVNSQGGSAKDGFDRIELVFTDRFGKVYDRGEANFLVTDINNYNFTVISDDGVDQGTIPLTKIIYDNPIGAKGLSISCDEVSDYINAQLANNPQKDVIKTKTYNRKLGPTGGASLQNNPKPVTLKQAKGINVDPSEYKRSASSISVKGENGDYKIHFYNSKSDGSNLVTCEPGSNPGNEFRVGLIGDFSGLIEKEDPSGIRLEYSMAILNGDNDHYCLMDTILVDKLKEILLKPQGQKAFAHINMDYEYMCTENGILANTTE